MFAGANKVFVLNTNTNEAKEVTLDQLFLNMIEYEVNGFIIVPPGYYIRDAGGYTVLRKIGRKRCDEKLYDVESPYHELLVTGDQMFIDYDPSKEITGFHGYSDYDYTITTAEEESRDLPFDVLCDVWEHPVINLKVFDLESDKSILNSLKGFLIYESDQTSEYVYSIETASGTFNCNNLYMKDSPLHNDIL